MRMQDADNFVVLAIFNENLRSSFRQSLIIRSSKFEETAENLKVENVFCWFFFRLPVCSGRDHRPRRRLQ
jgi:hypothetical protein